MRCGVAHISGYHLVPLPREALGYEARDLPRLPIVRAIDHEYPHGPGNQR